MRILFALFMLAVCCTSASAHHRYRHESSSWSDARPQEWCGWFMRQRLGVSDRAYNLAANWAHWGHAASGPAPGIIGVAMHHVFEVISVVGPGRVLAISGNDGNAVRTRERSTRGVIAWRSR